MPRRTAHEYWLIELSNDITGPVRMKCNRLSLLAHLHSNSDIPRSEILECVAVADLETRALAFTLIRYHNNRIRPPVAPHQIDRFAVDYYVDCLMNSSPRSDYVHSPYEAASDLVSFVKWRCEKTDADDDLMTFLTERVKNAYLLGNERVRLCIETGFLEHVFEYPGYRLLFDAWMHDPTLENAYRHALEWGQEHEKPIE